MIFDVFFNIWHFVICVIWKEICWELYMMIRDFILIFWKDLQGIVFELFWIEE